jgi:sigma-B regulation protein RsbU (phosphoserine phosphatase)
MIYDPLSDSFDELLGRGIALGVDETWSFEEQMRELWSDSEIVLIGTDGIWECENPQGESFGKKRLKGIIRHNKDKSSAEIVQAITDGLANHRETAPQQDDVTLVVIKKV